MTTKTVIITGAARRIGAYLARDLHARGMRVIIHYHTSEVEADRLVRELNACRKDSAFAVSTDLRDVDSIEEMLNTIEGFSDSIDVLINNASMFYPTPVGDTNAGQWRDLVGTNMKAPYFMSQACQPCLRKSRGCIINITDIYGEMPLKGYPVYSAAKAGLIMLTKSLALEMAPEIRVNAISPGAILWPENPDQDTQADITSKTLLGKSGKPADIANAVWFLIESGYVNAQVIKVDGGRLY